MSGPQITDFPLRSEIADADVFYVKVDGQDYHTTATLLADYVGVSVEAATASSAAVAANTLKLAGIEANATADQTAEEIATAYAAQVAIVSQADAEAGTSTTVYRWTPERVSQAVDALAAAGLSTIPTTGYGRDDQVVFSDVSDSGKVKRDDGRNLAYSLIVENAQIGTSYMLAAGRARLQRLVTMDNASANTLTIPTNAAVDFPIGSVVNAMQIGNGVTTVIATVGVTLNGADGGSVAVGAKGFMVSCGSAVQTSGGWPDMSFLALRRSSASARRLALDVPSTINIAAVAPIDAGTGGAGATRTLTATGGVSPITWALTGGDTAQYSLTDEGDDTATLTVPAAADFSGSATIVAADAAGATDSVTVAIDVLPQTLPADGQWSAVPDPNRQGGVITSVDAGAPAILEGMWWTHFVGPFIPVSASYNQPLFPGGQWPTTIGWAGEAVYVQMFANPDGQYGTVLASSGIKGGPGTALDFTTLDWVATVTQFTSIPAEPAFPSGVYVDGAGITDTPPGAAAPTVSGTPIPDQTYTLASRPRVFVTSDLGGSDKDDAQSLIHALLYANEVDFRGFAWNETGTSTLDPDSHFTAILNAYDTDLPNLRQASADYPSRASLAALNKGKGWLHTDAWTTHADTVPAAVQAIIDEAALASPSDPLWILAWGGMHDATRALKAAPAIAPNVRLITIAGQNQIDGDAYAWLAANVDTGDTLAGLWWIDMAETFRGWYVTSSGSNNPGANLSWVQTNIDGKGALGNLFHDTYCYDLYGEVDGSAEVNGLKMGDTPSLVYVLGAVHGADIEDPTDATNWGGEFAAKPSTGPNAWGDIPTGQTLGSYSGANTVYRHRTEAWGDFAKRAEWADGVLTAPLPVPQRASVDVTAGFAGSGLTFSLVAPPSGVAIAGPVVSWPRTAALDGQTITVTATNANGSVTDSFGVALAAGDLPDVTSASISPSTGAVGTTFVAAYVESGGNPSPTITYQWKLDGAPIGGATNATYTATGTGVLTAVVIASNASGTDTLESAGVTVTAAASVDAAYMGHKGSFAASGTPAVALLTDVLTDLGDYEQLAILIAFGAQNIPYGTKSGSAQPSGTPWTATSNTFGNSSSNNSRQTGIHKLIPQPGDTDLVHSIGNYDNTDHMALAVKLKGYETNQALWVGAGAGGATMSITPPAPDSLVLAVKYEQASSAISALTWPAGFVEIIPQVYRTNSFTAYSYGRLAFAMKVNAGTSQITFSTQDAQSAVAIPRA